jgi:hypothetical protein
MTQALTSSIRHEVAALVRAEMARQGIRNAALGERIGKNEVWVSRHVRLNPTQDFTVPELEQVARALGVPLSALIPTDDTPAEVTS